MKAAMIELTKDDTRALWHAVEGLRDLVRGMRGEGFSAAQLAAERTKVLTARRALRKVNAIRKAQACRRTAKVEDVQEQRESAGGAAA